MSKSSLYVIDNENKGKEYRCYKNSWLFSPIIWDELMWKYFPNEKHNKDLNIKKHFITKISFDNGFDGKLNATINKSYFFEDRIVWEITNQQIFFVKDKLIVSDNILKYLEYVKNSDENYQDHIIDRFKEIANDIRNIPNNYLYFAFKNTSCDDGVEYWFYDSETGENKSLSEWDKFITEFVIINGNKIEWKDNLDFFKKT